MIYELSFDFHKLVAPNSLALLLIFHRTANVRIVVGQSRSRNISVFTNRQIFSLVIFVEYLNLSRQPP